MNKHLLFLFISFFIAGLVIAQPFTMNPDIVPTELTLNPFKPATNEKMNGRISITNVTQVKDTLYFFVKGLSVYSPAYAGITMKDKTNSADIGLFKENWLKPSKGGNTGDKGVWDQKFKTEGDFGIRVIAKTKPCTYSIIVWNGNDIEVEVPSAFTYKEGGAADTGGGIGGFFKANLMYIIIGLLVIALGIVLLKLKKRKS